MGAWTSSTSGAGKTSRSTADSPAAVWELLVHGQVLTPGQVSDLLQGNARSFRASAGAQRPASESSLPPFDAAPSTPLSLASLAATATRPAISSTSTTGVTVTGIVALVVWAWAAISTIVQKTRADKLIRDSWDVSAVQIQELNGQVTAHAVLALVVATAATMPFFLAAALKR